MIARRLSCTLRRASTLLGVCLVALCWVGCKKGGGGGGGGDRTPPVVTLIGPNGGERWGGTRAISWSTTDANPWVVEISLSADSGATYATALGSTIADVGTFSWDTTASPDAATCRVRVVATDARGNVGAAAVSASDFVVDNAPPATTLGAPVGGEVWGGTQNISWTTSDANPGTVQVSISSDSGATYPVILAAAAPDTGSLAWDTTARSDGASYRIRIVPTDAAGNLGAASESAADLALDNTAPSATLTAPIGGETWSGLRTISWTTSDANPGTVEIRLSGDSGATYSTVIAPAAPDTGLYSWNTSSTPSGGTYRIRVVPTDAAGNAGLPSDSPGNFSISTFPTGLPTSRVSVDSAGGQGDLSSTTPSVSGAGQYVAFLSAATNLVPGDTNGVSDIFVRDRETGLTERVSVDSSGVQANSWCGSPVISADGRWVLLTSQATNLVSGDTNGQQDVFLHDRQTGNTERVSTTFSGGQANGISYAGDISPDGRYIVFASDATNIVPGDTNGVRDVFIRDHQAGTLERVSVSTGGGQGDALSFGGRVSADGRWVAFPSNATNLVAGDTNASEDVFVRDRQAGTTVRVSVSSSGAQGNGSSGSGGESISADGRYVAFRSLASNLVASDTNGTVDVFVRDLQASTTLRASVSSLGVEGNGGSGSPTSMSADGRYVAFLSDATNLVLGDTNASTDVLVHDNQTGATARASLSSSGGQASGQCLEQALSADGRYVVFRSLASDYVVGDTNAAADVFAAPNPL